MEVRRRYDIRAILAKLGIVVTEENRNRLYALCPYHEDRTATNWFIREHGERAGQHFCFACNEGGGLVDLVQHARGYANTFSAREWLERYEQSAEGAPLPTGLRVRVHRATDEGFRMPKEVCWDPLDEWVTPARDYALLRGITAEQVRRWGIGYAVDGRLAGRIVFPLHDSADEVAGYHARIFMGEGPRYYYPHLEQERPNLDLIFGERHWPPPRQRDRVTVFEGAIKSLAFERALGEPFAALGGVNIRPAHVGKLAGFGTVVIATDDNQAGDGAAAQLHAQLRRHIGVVRVTLPADPDEMSSDSLRALFRP